jgi:transposase
MARSVDGAKRQAWQERLRRYERSGLTIAAFCRRERVSQAAFYYWRKRLGGAEAASEMPDQGEPSFVPVRITGAAPVEVRLPNGACILLPAGDPAMLAAAITAVGDLPLANQAESGSC